MRLSNKVAAACFDLICLVNKADYAKVTFQDDKALAYQAEKLMAIIENGGEYQFCDDVEDDNENEYTKAIDDLFFDCTMVCYPDYKKERVF